MITDRRRLSITGFALLLVFTLVTGVASSATASAIEPIFVPGNPSCTDLGYDFGYKPQPEPPPTGTYTFPGTAFDVTITSDGTYFDWSSTLGVDAVIVKGGPNANAYTYDPESYGGIGLHSPINPNNNMPYAISHLEFCYDFEVDVTKTAETTYTRTWEWSIDKTVTPDEWHLFKGDTGTSSYTVAVMKTGYTDSVWAVGGTITIENNTPFDATLEGVSDEILGFGAVAVDCGVAYPYPLLVGDSLTCTYGADLPDRTDRTNTATVETSGMVGGGAATAAITFGDPTTVVNGTINVSDTNGGSWMFSDTGSMMYEKTFDCASGGDTYGNTATIVETGQSAEASVTVHCYELDVTKTAETQYNRYWNWTIDKWADQTDLILSPGQQFLVNYEVTVDATFMDRDWAVSGVISIFNPNLTRSAELTSVSDLVSPDIAATVDCPFTTVPAGGLVTCSYSAPLPDATARTNTATATLQNYAFAFDGTGTAAGTTDFSGSADVVFGEPTAEIDECVDVSDTFAGFLGTVCADSLPATFSYTRTVGPYHEPDGCGDHLVQNTATFVTNDTGTTGWDSRTVNVFVPCDLGCTLTPGYWKTHSEYGPAPYDDTWALLPDGADTMFFGTGYTYFEILWMPPTGGNAYLILAHAYLAAELNVLNGASIPPDVLAAWIEAGALLVEYETAVSLPRKPKAIRDRAIELATILDDYNNGFIGPGHCSE